MLAILCKRLLDGPIRHVRLCIADCSQGGKRRAKSRKLSHAANWRSGYAIRRLAYVSPTVAVLSASVTD
jgi:hypothetical protein